MNEYPILDAIEEMSKNPCFLDCQLSGQREKYENFKHVLGSMGKSPEANVAAKEFVEITPIVREAVKYLLTKAEITKVAVRDRLEMSKSQSLNGVEQARAGHNMVMPLSK
jgi:hypothetical protein